MANYPITEKQARIAIDSHNAVKAAMSSAEAVIAAIVAGIEGYPDGAKIKDITFSPPAVVTLDEDEDASDDDTP